MKRGGAPRAAPCGPVPRRIQGLAFRRRPGILAVSD
jgi:hypothetical protein